jgi:NAD(P)-dependent dehydrogenase (short-subunit alcohol dehydrogenase family)
LFFSGIGRAIARSLARSGANVALLDLDMERQAQTKTECEEYGAIVFAYECDVTKVDVCESIFNSIERDLGPVE